MIHVGLRITNEMLRGSSAPATHTVTISNDGFLVPPCTITPAGPVVVVGHGANQAVRMVGTLDYDGDPTDWILSLKVDGVAVPAAVGSADYTHTFTNVTADHTLAVNFSNGK